jgi:8-oxo-dGTP pyrophosphatase MutT (NUDIX family)
VPHIHTGPGQVDFTVEVFVVCDGRVLLRMHDKLGFWLSVGGHIELHEDPAQAAVREVLEEVGLEVRLDDSHMLYREIKDGYEELPPPVFMCRLRMGDSHDHVTMTYFARSNSRAVVPSGSDRSNTDELSRKRCSFENAEQRLYCTTGRVHRARTLTPNDP